MVEYTHGKWRRLIKSLGCFSMKPKTMKDLDIASRSAWLIKAEAIKWVKEDIKLLEVLTIPELRKIAEVDLEKWMYRLNITEEDLQ